MTARPLETHIKFLPAGQFMRRNTTVETAIALAMFVMPLPQLTFGQEKDPTSPQVVYLTRQGQLTSSLYSTFRQRYLTGGEQGGVQSWAIPSMKSQAGIRQDARAITALAESPNGNWLAFAYFNRDPRQQDQVAVYDRSRKAVAWTVSMERFAPMSLAFTLDNRQLVVGTNPHHGYSSAIFVLDVAGGKEVKRLEKEDPGTRYHRPSQIALSRDGDFLASTGFRGEIEIWDTKEWTFVRKIAAHKSRVIGLACSPLDGSLTSFAEETDADDGTAVKIWSIPAAKPVATIHLGSPVECVAFDADGSLMAVGTRNKLTPVSLWDMKGKRLLGGLTLPQFYPSQLAFVPDSTQLVGRVSKSIALWDYAWIHDGAVAQSVRDKQDPHGVIVRNYIQANHAAKELVLAAFERIEDDDQLADLAGMKHLRKLTLGDLKVKGRGFKQLESCDTLRELNLAGSIESLKELGRLTQLETLRFFGLCRIESWQGLDQLTNLRELDLSGAQIGGGDLQAIRRLKQLKKLTLRGSTSGAQGVEKTYFSGRDLFPVEALDELEYLEIEGECVDEQAVAHLKSLTQLRTLIATDTSMGDSVADAIESMVHLREARLGALTFHGLTKIAQHPTLATLYFDGSAINSYGLAALGDSQSLRELSIGGYWTPYDPLKYARDLKTMSPKKVLAYDHVRMLQELAMSESAWENRRKFLMAAGVFWGPPAYRDAAGELIEPSDVRHSRHDKYLDARNEYRETMGLLRDEKLRLDDLRGRSAEHAKAVVKDAFQDDDDRQRELLQIIDRASQFEPER